VATTSLFLPWKITVNLEFFLLTQTGGERISAISNEAQSSLSKLVIQFFIIKRVFCSFTKLLTRRTIPVSASLNLAISVNWHWETFSSLLPCFLILLNGLEQIGLLIFIHHIALVLLLLWRGEFISVMARTDCCDSQQEAVASFSL